jgi:hypothetical protein
MQNNYIYIYIYIFIYLKKLKEINLEILTNGKIHTFFCVLLQILFNC